MSSTDLAARSVVEMLEDARAAGVGFVLSHQSSSSLKTRDADLYGILFENCSFKQCLTLEDPRVIDLFREIAGRKSERRLGGSTAQSYGTSESRTHSHSHQSGFSHGGEDHSLLWGTSQLDPRWSEGQSFGESSGQHVHRGQSETQSWREEMVSALTPEMITSVNDTELLSLVHVKGVADKSRTQTDGFPMLVQGLFPLPKTHADAWLAEKWRLKPAPPQQLEFSAVADQPTVASEQQGSGAQPSARPPIGGPIGRNEGETRELRSGSTPLLNVCATRCCRNPSLSRASAVGTDIVRRRCSNWQSRPASTCTRKKTSSRPGRSPRCCDRSTRRATIRAKDNGSRRTRYLFLACDPVSISLSRVSLSDHVVQTVWRSWGHA